MQRVLKFAKYLPQFGWQPVILTVEDGDYPSIDHSLESEVPDECIVYKTKAFEPYGLYRKLTGKNKDEEISTDVLGSSSNAGIVNKFASLIRRNVFIPDARVGWIPTIVKEGQKIIEREKPELILSSSPPHSLQVGAMKLAKKTGLKWIADFRDPWLEIVYYQKIKRNKITVSVDKHFERNVLRSADYVITIGDTIADQFKTKVSEQNYSVITNGYDQADFDNLNRNFNEKFTITYTGVLSKERIPHALLEAMKQLKEEGTDDITLQFAGNVCNELTQKVAEKKLNAQVKYIGYVPHGEALQMLAASDMLLLVIDDVPGNKGFLSGKLFDYLGCRRFILAFGPLDGDANKIITETESGIVINYKDEKTTREVLKQFYLKHRNYNYNSMPELYERKKLTSKLVQIMESIK